MGPDRRRSASPGGRRSHPTHRSPLGCPHGQAPPTSGAKNTPWAAKHPPDSRRLPGFGPAHGRSAAERRADHGRRSRTSGTGVHRRHEDRHAEHRSFTGEWDALRTRLFGIDGVCAQSLRPADRPTYRAVRDPRQSRIPESLRRPRGSGDGGSRRLDRSGFHRRMVGRTVGHAGRHGDPRDGVEASGLRDLPRGQVGTGRSGVRESSGRSRLRRVHRISVPAKRPQLLSDLPRRGWRQAGSRRDHAWAHRRDLLDRSDDREERGVHRGEPGSSLLPHVRHAGPASRAAGSRGLPRPVPRALGRDAVRGGEGLPSERDAAGDLRGDGDPVRPERRTPRRRARA